jgi:NTP pyrophosphatase (non-canonical NTP hydrolase)
MGLNGEAGECIDIFKKYFYQGHELDKEKLIDELGDVLWYIAETCTGIGVTMEEVAKRNIEKLRKRYPDGFEVERSVNRDGI